MPHKPAISVVIPTYRRPALLRRAITSLLVQDFQDWELVISDDEPEPGEAGSFAGALALADRRVRYVRNPGPRGQSGNLNYCMSQARAAWIKPLYDDDALEAGCLSAMLDAARHSAGAAIVRCLADRVGLGPRRFPERRGRRARVEELDPEVAPLAMYIQDLDIGVPTQVLVRSGLVRAGAVMPAEGDFVIGVDVLWYIRLLRGGSLVMLNEPLVRHYQGGHETVTSRASEAEFFLECDRTREVLLPFIEPSQRPPPLATVRQMLRLIRALRNFRDGRPLAAGGLAIGCWRPRAWVLAARWFLRRAWPGRFEAVPRRVLVP